MSDLSPCVRPVLNFFRLTCRKPFANAQIVTAVSQLLNAGFNRYLVSDPDLDEAFHAGLHPTANCEPLFFRCN